MSGAAKRDGGVCVLGVFNADLTFTGARLPVMGETLLGTGFRMGPGGKGSNQAVAAGMAATGTGLPVRFITRLGRDAFAETARDTWRKAGVDASLVIEDAERPTGTAFIFVSSESGDNAIIVSPGAASALSAEDMDAVRGAITGARVFIAQLEQPLAAAEAGLRIARDAGVATILNPAPATDLSDALLATCDYLTPNESEAAALTGIAVETEDDARRAAERLLARGAGAILMTLGARGVLLHDDDGSEIVPALPVDAVVDTTGAGDAFNGAFAVALAEGRAPRDAARFGCAAASLAVQRPGAAAAMPARDEIDAALAVA